MVEWAASLCPSFVQLLTDSLGPKLALACFALLCFALLLLPSYKRLFSSKEVSISNGMYFPAKSNAPCRAKISLEVRGVCFNMA